MVNEIAQSYLSRIYKKEQRGGVLARYKKLVENSSTWNEGVKYRDQMNRVKHSRNFYMGLNKG